MELQAWGVGNFENEPANDWLEDLCESKDLQAIMIALSGVVEFSGTTELEIADCCCALAAAEIVAAAASCPVSELPPNGRKFVKEMSLGVTESVLALTIKAIEQIRIASSLLRYWKSQKKLSEWLGVLENLEERLEEASAKIAS